MVERMNKIMGKYLSKVVSDHQSDCDQYLHFTLMANRSAVQETTGQRPASVLYGREIRLPRDFQFGTRPGQEETVGNEYVENLQQKLGVSMVTMRDNNETNLVSITISHGIIAI
uniref:Integrase catalytic domain-containing protein n=1 Tax=Photinus pyralis TaxID=7054 RepID=A0A1Y1MK60_PHOPY